MKITSAIFLLCVAQKTAKFQTPLLAKDHWKTVDEILSVRAHSKLIEMHRDFGQFSEKYKDLSGKINKKLNATRMNWLFFEDSETKEIFAENVKERDGIGNTALHKTALYTDDAKLVRALIEAGVDVNARGYSNWTALHNASYNNYLEIGKCFVEAGARLNLRTYADETPLDIAIQKNHYKFAEMLRKYQK